jgi:hypothetical protein
MFTEGGGRQKGRRKKWGEGRGRKEVEKRERGWERESG